MGRAWCDPWGVFEVGVEIRGHEAPYPSFQAKLCTFQMTAFGDECLDLWNNMWSLLKQTHSFFHLKCDPC